MVGKYWKGIRSTIVSHCLNETAFFTPHGITSQASLDAFLAVFLPGSRFAKQRAQIVVQYDCVNRFGGDFTACIAAIIRDASFTCNTRDLLSAFPSKTYMMRYGFLIPSKAFHASDLLPLFSNSYDEMVRLLQNNGLKSWVGAAYSWLLFKNIATVYQTYFASFAAHSGDPNGLQQPKNNGIAAPMWPLADGSGENVTKVLTVQHPSGQDPFVLDQPDDQNQLSTCRFWNKLAQDLDSASGSHGVYGYEEL